MALEVLARMGKAIHNRGITDQDRIWFGHTYISPAYEFLIDENGSILGVRKYKKSEIQRIPVPIGCYGKIWSDANNKDLEHPHLVSDHIGILMPTDSVFENARGLFLKRMQEAARKTRHWMLPPIIHFVESFPECGKSDFAMLNPSAKEYFCVVIQKEGVNYPAWEDNELKSVMGDFFARQIKEFSEPNLFCEITGWDCSYHMIRHSQVLRGAIKPRAVSEKTYNRSYGGSKDDFIITQIGAETEACYNFAINYIDDKVYRDENDRIFYLGTLNGSLYLPIHLSANNFELVLSKQGIDCGTLQIMLEELVATSPLCLLIFDNINKGRISFYHAQIFTVKESQTIITNILRWFHCLNPNRSPKNRFSARHICKELYGENSVYMSYFYQDIVNGDWQQLRSEIFNTAIQSKYYLGILIRIINTEYQNNMSKLETDLDFIAGKMIAYAELIEDKYVRTLKKRNPNRDYYVHLVHDQIAEFLMYPLGTWEMIRLQLEEMMNSSGESYIYFKLLSEIQACETRITVDGDWEQIGKNEARILLGYDCTRAVYFDAIKEEIKNNCDKEVDCEGSEES